MKSIYLISLCVCLITFLPSQTDCFGCSKEACGIIPFFGPVCCLLAKMCCDVAVKELQQTYNKPLAECQPNTAAAGAAASPR
ncbi:hypothetical protein CDAR_447851 [Caerostris darwini]|uniref:Uncharacterized protein n=1 Tax=Caerostris darwini TaxID=1538125 RepID=A0AAV4PQW2_9ARAC|nr:hypothetical protein CDAR_447851 [Caerostris darwini]